MKSKNIKYEFLMICHCCVHNLYNLKRPKKIADLGGVQISFFYLFSLKPHTFLFVFIFIIDNIFCCGLKDPNPDSDVVKCEFTSNSMQVGVYEDIFCLIAAAVGKHLSL